MVAVVSWSDITTVAKVLRLWYSNLNKIKSYLFKPWKWIAYDPGLTYLSFSVPKIDAKYSAMLSSTENYPAFLACARRDPTSFPGSLSYQEFQANTQITFKFQARSPSEGVMRNHTKAACKRRFECEGCCSLLWLAFPGWAYSIYPWVGRWSEAPHTLTLFKTNIADFPTLFKTEFRFLIPCLRH